MGMKYIYNINCANYLMKHGAECIGTGINQNSKKTYWVFDYKQCQKAYDMWNKHKLVKEIMSEINTKYERDNHEDREKKEQKYNKEDNR